MINALALIKDLFQGYFNQDYDIMSDEGTIDGAFKAFLQDLSAEETQLFKNKIEYLINNPVPDWDGLFFGKLGLEYLYLNDWPSAIDWLRHLRDETDRLLNPKSKGSNSIDFN